MSEDIRWSELQGETDEILLAECRRRATIVYIKDPVRRARLARIRSADFWAPLRVFGYICIDVILAER